MKISGVKHNSAIVRFVGMMLLTLAIPFTIVLILTTNRLSAMERESANQFLSSNLKTVSSTVDQVLRNLEFSHTLMFQNRDFINGIHRLVPHDVREEYSDFRNVMGIRNSITTTAITNDYIDSVYVYSFTAQRMFSSRINWDAEFNHFDGVGVEWLDTYLTGNLSYPWHITGEVREDRNILSSYRDIWVHGYDFPIALISINVDSTRITEMLSDVMPYGIGYIFIIDANGKIISHREYPEDTLEEIISHMPPDVSEGYFSIQVGDSNLFTSFYTSAYSGFRYVVATSLDQIQTTVPVMIQLILLFLALLALLIFLALFLAHRYFYTPIASVYTGMKKLQEGDFSVQLPKNKTYEFDYINRNFNHTVDSIRKLINENYANELVNKEAELRNLQNQLNEHFLYNTLDSIHWLAKKENASKACDMVFALANFYRLSLSSGKDVIPVSDVLDMLRNYLFIQNFRMNDSLIYKIVCEPSLLSQLILKNLLQPIVENSIIHGISGLERDGIIEVNISRQNEQMRIKVSDNGKGFADDKLKQIYEQLELQNPYCEHSFALKSIQSQLRIFYGLDIKLNIETVLGQGSSVWFDLPVGSPITYERRSKAIEDETS